VGLLSFLVKGLLLALEVHPIMRSRVKFRGDEKWLEVGRDGVVGVAVSGMSSLSQSPKPVLYHYHGSSYHHRRLHHHPVHTPRPRDKNLS
jgi:2-oxoisovalerate dehydrogenase E2 component (dihydrolipoyl transacylase)